MEKIMSVDTLLVLFYQTIILGIFILIIKKVMSSTFIDFSKIYVTFDYLEKCVNRQKQEISERITELKNEIENLRGLIIGLIKNSHK